MVYYAKEIGLTKCFKENILGIKEETVTVRAKKKKTKAKKKTSILMHP